MLLERKEQLEKIVADLERERSAVASHIQTLLINDKEVAEIEEWCEVRDGLDAASFEDKQTYFTLLDVRGKLAVENIEKVAHIKCKLGKQRVSVAVTSPLSNSQYGNALPVTLTVQLVIEALKRHVSATPPGKAKEITSPR